MGVGGAVCGGAAGQAETYSDFSLILSGDVLLAHCDRGCAHLDRAHASSHRICFSSLPRAVLALRMLGPSLVGRFWLSPAGVGPLRGGRGRGGSVVLAMVCFALLWACLVLLKTALSVQVEGNAPQSSHIRARGRRRPRLRENF